MTAATVAPQPVPASSIGQWIHRHPVPAFLVMVYGLSWSFFLPSLLSQRGIGLLPFDVPLKPFILLASILGLTLPAFIVTRVTNGRDGVRELRRRYTHWRVGFYWYVLALFGLPLACVLAASLWRGVAPLETLSNRPLLLFATFLPLAVSIALIISFWEEGAWTAFLLPRLQDRWGPLGAAVVVNMCQALVHVPLIFIAGGLTDGGKIPVNQYWIYLSFLFVLTIPVRVLMTWLWNGTAGSLIVVALFHGAFNATSSENFIPRLVPGSPDWTYGVYAALALVLTVLTRGRLSYRPDWAPGRDEQ